MAVPDAVLDDLRERIRRTRWPDPAPGEPWSQGTDLDYLRDLLAYWADGFDWRAQERQLNRYRPPHRRRRRRARCTSCTIAATAAGCRWSSPTAGRARSSSCCRWSTGSATASTWSCRPCPATRSRPGRRTGRRPGVRRRACGTGSCRGSATSATARTAATSAPASPPYMALSQPDRMIGIHLSTPEMSPYTGPGAPPLTAEEQAYLEQVAALGRDRARLQRDPVHPAADPRATG